MKAPDFIRIGSSTEKKDLSKIEVGDHIIISFGKQRERRNVFEVISLSNDIIFKRKKGIEYKKDWANYRKKAWDKLPHKCVSCGIKNEKVLIVHHKDKNRKNGNIENLEILCLNCHSLIHRENK